ncbi:unnamed protein product [Rotaria sordida]|uniref:Band 7 domain-containing protein n=1 Tax=Rotaria sordida TaxID=392033 RepID=A0A813MIB8_9BILA|nr:unnamed protein product [Rotaria sordida]CAF0790891.1 unnamed protein product [Rotaria sordida]
MSSLGRSPSSAKDLAGTLSTPEEIELREVNQPLLPTNNDIPSPTEQNDETTPFSLNSDDDENGQPTIEFRPARENETDIRQRHRRSTSSNRSPTRRNGGLRQIARDFWADLMPADNRNARILPVLIFIIFIVIILLTIIFVALGYTSIDYDEFGVTHNLWTGIMDLKHPYLTGVYLILPWKRMIKFDKTARYLNFDSLTIFTTDQASVILDATIVYRIRPDQIEPIWLNFANAHESILRLVAENIFRNHGNQFSIYDYRARREHVEYNLSRILQQTLSGDCCPICCQHHTCSKTIEYSCKKLIHCNNTSITCSHGYFVDIDAVYIFKVALPQQVIKRLHILMLKPIYTEIAESQENTSLIWIETERQRNVLLNKARETLMNALAKYELIREKARIIYESRLLKQLSSSEGNLFRRLNIQTTTDKLSTSFLLEMNHLANLTKTVDIDSLVTQCDPIEKTKPTNDLFDFVPSLNVFDMTEFISILDN